ncbi:MAG: dihydropteroate synthase, partial [Acidobacteriota bacterium]
EAHIVDFDHPGRLGDHMRRLGGDAIPPGFRSLLRIPRRADLLEEWIAACAVRAGAHPPAVLDDGSLALPGDRRAFREFAGLLATKVPDLGGSLRRLLERDALRLHRWGVRGRVLETGPRSRVMGVVNVTPDSFCDGGRYLEPAAAVEHGLRLAADGADILDVGGESTRPGARPVSEKEERERVVPVVRALARRTDVPVSVDTRHAAVAAAALEAGARIVNDVTALGGDPDMGPLVARAGAGLVLMHMQGTPETMQEDPRYGDVVADVLDFLADAVRRAVEAGVDEYRIAVDPGIGFGKRLEHNLTLLRHLASFRALGRPVVVGASRKSFLGKVTDRPVEDRLAGSLGVAAAATMAGAAVIRAHDLPETVDALRAVDAVRDGGCR